MRRRVVRGDNASLAPAQPPVPLVSRSAHDVLFHVAGAPVTAARFLADVHRLAVGLPDAPHVANLCQHRYWFSVAFAAALVRGQISLLSSDRSPEALARLADQYPGLGAIAEEPLPQLGLPTHVIAPGEHSPGPAACPSIPATQLAAIVFTSGSTGEPVAHRKLWGALAARSRDAGRRFRMVDMAPAAIVGTVPPYHMYGFETTVLLPLHAAASSWCGPAFFPHDIGSALEAVQGRRVLVTTPLQLRALMQASVDLPPLHRIISATAPLPPDLAEAAERRWRTETWEIFGATEVGSIASRRTVEGDLWTTYPRVRLHGGHGREGGEEVLVAGPFAEPCPLNDVVERLDALHFRLLGRRTDVVKLGGRRASLADLTVALTRIEGVVDGLFVAPDDLEDRPTARLLAFVVAPDRSAEAIMAALRERIDPVFLPRRIVQVDALPRNEVGKLPERALTGLRARVGEG